MCVHILSIWLNNKCAVVTFTMFMIEGLCNEISIHRIYTFFVAFLWCYFLSLNHENADCMVYWLVYWPGCKVGKVFFVVMRDRVYKTLFLNLGLWRYYWFFIDYWINIKPGTFAIFFAWLCTFDDHEFPEIFLRKRLCLYNVHKICAKIVFLKYLKITKLDLCLICKIRWYQCISFFFFWGTLRHFMGRYIPIYLWIKLSPSCCQTCVISMNLIWILDNKTKRYLWYFCKVKKKAKAD